MARFVLFRILLLALFYFVIMLNENNVYECLEDYPTPVTENVSKQATPKESKIGGP